MDQLILVLELVGTLAFAASGAMTALKKIWTFSAYASWA